MDSQGVIYLACGPGYLDQAIFSVNSLKANMPTVNVTLFTDQEADDPLFDQILPMEHDPQRRFKSKTSVMGMSPYDRTLFLDCDTVVLGDLSDLFTCLEIFDCGASLNTHRGSPYGFERFGPGLSMLNSSTFAFRKSEVMTKVFESLQVEYEKAAQILPTVGDQEILTKCIIEQGARFWTLPDEYNFHLAHINRAVGPIRVATSHELSLKQIASRLNRFHNERTWIPLEMKMWVELNGPGFRKSLSVDISQDFG